jgi:hypothetical protein
MIGQHGRVAQRESASLTRKRSQVQTLSRPPAIFTAQRPAGRFRRADEHSKPLDGQQMGSNPPRRTGVTATYLTVLRAPSAALLLPDEGFQLPLVDPPTRVRLRSRWREQGLEHPVPMDLWVEVEGEGSSLDEAVRRHAPLARGVASTLAFVANAAVEPLEVELAYDTTADRAEREFLQVFVREPSAIPSGGRVVSADRLRLCFDAILTLGPTPRLQRALFQYDLALRNWQLGSEYQSLDHLWIAAENLVGLLLDRRVGGNDRKEFARAVGITVDRTRPSDPPPRWRQALVSWALLSWPSGATGAPTTQQGTPRTATSTATWT